MKYPPRWKRALVCCTCLGFLLLLHALAAPSFGGTQNPNLDRGFETARAYAVGEIDNVNLFNGNLVLTIPIGSTYYVGGNLSYGLSLVYNGKTWDWHQGIGGLSRAMANWDSNAGFGWQLHYGKVIRPEQSERNDSGLWTYLSPDGGEHSFHANLHPNEAVTAGVFYTRDGSYLRLKVTSPSEVIVEFPGGNRHTFQQMDAVEHWLTRMEDAFGNYMTVTYPSGAASSEWLVSDSTGRSHRFVLVQKMLDKRAVRFVSSVELAAFGNTKATYSFSYQSAELDRPVPHDPLTGVATRAFFPLLVGVTQPDNSTWEMPVGYYDRFRDSQSAALSGQLLKLRLPTRGMLAWSFSRWRFPTAYVPDPGGIPEPAAFVEYTSGVATRSMLTAGGFEIGKWTYTSSLVLPAGYPTVRPVTKTTTVVDPLGHKSVNYFSVFLGEGVSPSPDAEIWHYGLPFSVLETDGEGRYVSKKIYKAGQETASRTDWVRYDSDLSEGGYFLSGENSRVYTSRVDWDGKTKKETLSDFDGLGNYRSSYSDGNYRTDAGGPGNGRSSYTAFNPGSGTYPGAFNLPSTSSRWILGTFSEQWEEEAWGRRTREYVFDDRGFPIRERDRLEVSGTRNSNDTVRVLTRDAAGNTTGEAWYGGYFDPVGTGALSSLAVPATAAAKFEMTYQYGQLATRRYQGANFYLANRTIDQNTGYPKSAKDITGIETSYSYDIMGRRTWIKPGFGHDAWIQMVYQNADSASTPAAYVYERPNSSTTSLLRESQLRFDDFGRLDREARNTSSGWSYRSHGFDAAGNMAAVSQWQAGTPSQWTYYQNFDPFGRAEMVVTPDGKTLNSTYYGDWGVQRWFYVGVSRSSDGKIQEQRSTSAEDFDIAGRTWRYQELDHFGSLNLDAYYGYTSGGNLASVKVVAPNGNTQHRFFSFDARGFLTSETHPETGTTTYSQIDARGHANRKRQVASGLDLGFAYDSYERLYKVWDRSRSADLKTWVYGTANTSGNYKLGKVEKTTHFNRRRIPFAPTETWVDVPVEESFVYGGRGGRVSSRTTTLSNNYSFTQSATWSALGELTQETYPRCVAGDCNGLGAARIQNYTYSQGDLTGVSGWASLTYHDNGMLATVAHNNTVTDTIQKDPWQMPRPRNIRISGPFSTAEIGEHSYDGGGNLVLLRPAAGVATFAELTGPPPAFAPGGAAILESFFLYDAYGRLRTWNDKTGKSQDYDFDAFGNLTRITDFDGLHPATYRNFAVSQANNQLTSLVSYDNRGNLKARSLGTSTETYDWDLFDQLAAQTFPSATHLYTADGERIWTLRYNASTKQLDETFTLRGLGNQVLTVYQHQSNSSTGQNIWNWQEDYIYRGGQLLAKATNQAAPLDKIHFTLDHLGTARVATNANGQPFEGYHYLPFGEQYGGTLTSSERMRYTGQERDQNQSGTVDDLDYMHARYCSPNLGRFLSPDPQLGQIAAPQSWNRYSYASNNPMNYTDPTGEYVTTCANDDAECNKNANAFEAARQKLLNSGDKKFEAAAGAYGDPGVANGVTVSFEEIGPDQNGGTKVWAKGSDVDGSMSLRATVRFKPGLSEVVLLGSVAHEGTHVLNGKRFVDTMRVDSATNTMIMDVSKNLTVYDLEMDAFRMTHAAYARWGNGRGISWSCSGCTLGKKNARPAEVDLAISRILAADEDNYYSATKEKPGPRQMPEWQ